jgi:putative tryptophan/tyrosine transport system substrate-binding protein
MPFRGTNRRAFIAGLGSAAAWPVVARAQLVKERPLIACLTNVTKEATASPLLAFMAGMHDLGWIEGQNFNAIFRFADDDNGQLPQLADELLRANPDIMLTFDPPSAFAAHEATHSLPIVSALLTDPVGLGLVTSYAHPGGNLTGMLVAVEGLSGKQVELAAELIPGTATLGMLINPTNTTSKSQQREIEIAAATKGIKIAPVDVAARADLDSAFEALVNASVQGIIGMRDGLLIASAARIGQLAIASRLPTVFGTREQVLAGGLAGYDVNLISNSYRAAYFVDKILKGVKPSDLPLEFPTRLELVINVKTAKALAMEIPPTLLARADEVIE